jgi:phosphoribosylanthranilate isomerase
VLRIKNESQSGRTELGKDIHKMKKYTDFILLDSYSKDIYGGTGVSFDWDIARDYNRTVPIILSGGLDAENIEKAIKTAKPFGVDASSKLEIYPGKKDISKVSEFIKTLRSME